MKATLDLWKNSRSYILPEEDCQPKYNVKILIHGAGVVPTYIVGR